MHRAEKSSSKICRNREVERAQELHRKKIDGVKAYVNSISKPVTTRSGAFFRRKPTILTPAPFHNPQNCQQHPSPQTIGNTSTAVSFSSTISVGVHDQNDPVNDDTPQDKGSIAPYDSNEEDSKELQKSKAKMDEFREAASLSIHSPHSNKTSKIISPPPRDAPKKTMNGSFRTRRLKEIQHDNTGLFERIKKSTTHYRNEDLRRDWQQHISYLSSICEFPVSKELLFVPTDVDKPHVQTLERSHYDSLSRTDNAVITSRCANLSSIALPVMVHPIKALRSSPKKTQLNLSPAFRSLRKAMPHHPLLPPITSPKSESVGNANNINDDQSPSLCSTLPMADISSQQFMTIDGHEVIASHLNDSQNRFTISEDQKFPSRTSSSAVTTSIGELYDSYGQAAATGDAKYQLLKTGRFIGGSYLSLTVFCGDGVMNAYGFDIFAFHGELNVEYKLPITKEMTHELLDTISSSSLAAVTAAAAGTNLSMNEIAQNICDHVKFTVLGSGGGEMIFLAPSVSSAKAEKGAIPLVDSPASSFAFCIHRTVEMINLMSNEATQRPSNMKRKMHIYASTRPSKSCPASMSTWSDVYESTNNCAGDGLTICFQVYTDSPSQVGANLSHRMRTPLELEVNIDDLCQIIDASSCNREGNLQHSYHQNRGSSLQDRLSLDRMVMFAIHHLHVVHVPGGENGETLTEVLILNESMNKLLHTDSSDTIPSVTTATIEKGRSKYQLPPSSLALHSNDPSFLHNVLLQTGLVWKQTYLLVQISVESHTNHHEPSKPSFRQQPSCIEDVDDDLVLVVFNPMTGNFSVRRLSPDEVDAIAERLKVIAEDEVTETSSKNRYEDMSLISVFTRKLLSRLHLDVDLFGHEVITFPSLESKQSGDVRLTDRTSPSNKQIKPQHPRRRRGYTTRGGDVAYDHRTLNAIVTLQGVVRGYLYRKQFYEDEDDLETDTAEENTWESEDLDAPTELRGNFFNYLKDEQDENKALDEDSDNIEAEAAMQECEDSPNAALRSTDLPLPNIEATNFTTEPEPPITPPTELRQELPTRTKQGRKLADRFCLCDKRNTPDFMTCRTLAISARGQLEIVDVEQ